MEWDRFEHTLRSISGGVVSVSSMDGKERKKCAQPFEL